VKRALGVDVGVLGSLLAAGVLLLAGVVAPPSARAQTYADAPGFFADFGVGLGWDNLAGPLQPVDNGTMVGFAFAGGYRFNSWAAAEVEFLWVGGGELTNGVTGQRLNASLTALDFAARLYPMAFAQDWMPQWIQPYAVFGIGTGLGEFAPTTPFAFGSTSRTVLLARIGLGLDVMLTKHWGTTLGGSYYVTNNDALTGAGTLKIGVLCRF